MHKSMFARILICSMSLAIAAVVMLAQDAGSKSAKTDHQPDFLQIITPHEGVDFTGFSADLVRVVKRNWYAKVPSEAKQNIKGRVVVGFGIQKDGQLSNAPKVEVSSGNKALSNGVLHDANRRRQRPNWGFANGSSCDQPAIWTARPDFAACGRGDSRNG
jgi:hypothetical protein